MKYNHVGKSGLVVSQASLGSWLTYGEGVDETPSLKIVQSAYDQGITSFDTANAYNQGAAERILGKALKAIPRTKIVVSTKIFWPMGDGANEKGLSRKSVIEQTNLSLQRLGMEYVDVLYCHRYDPGTPLIETLGAINDLIRQGKVIYFGVSEWTPKQIADAVHLCDSRLMDRMIVNQPSYNLLNRYIEKEVIPTCDEYGIGQIVFSPLAQGMLTGKYRKGAPAPEGSRAASVQGSSMRARYMNDETFDKVEAFRSLAKQVNIPMHLLALAWLADNASVSSIILGASRIEQVAENLKAFNVALTPDNKAAIDAIFQE